MFPIALQLYSIREDMERDFAGCLKKVAALGYDGVEFAGLLGHSPAEIKALLAENGLAPLSAHVPYAEMVADPQGVLADYAEIGCKFVAVPYLTEEYRMGGEKGDEAVAAMKRLGETARSLGMTLLYHNHDFEFEQIDGQFKLDLLYSAIPAELLQTEVDTCWVKVAGLDPAAYLRQYTGRAPVVHLKDFYVEGGDGKGAYELIGITSDPGKAGGTFEFRPLGAGKQDFPAILAAAKDAGAGWVVVEQDRPTPGKTAFECAEISINYIKSIQ